MIRILLVDDQKMVREALKISLEPESDLQIVGIAENGIAAIEQVEILQPDIVIMNMEMPILDGATATKKITSEHIDTKVLMLTSYDSDEYIIKSLAMGAKGYLLKNTDAKDIAGAVRNIHKGYTQISPGLLEKLLVYTDSGIIISKLQQSASNVVDRSLTIESSEPATLLQAAIAKPQKTVPNLEVAYSQQQEEIIKLKECLDKSEQEIPQIRKNLASNKKSVWLLASLGFLSLTVVGWFLFKLYYKTENIQASIKTNVIPLERVGMYGEFSLSGIAERVAKTFKQDPSLADISTIYIAQEKDAIILTGTVPNASLLRRMENLAKQVPGVNRVYTSQVAIQQDLDEEFLGAREQKQ